MKELAMEKNPSDLIAQLRAQPDAETLRWLRQTLQPHHTPAYVEQIIEFALDWGALTLLALHQQDIYSTTRPLPGYDIRRDEKARQVGRVMYEAVKILKDDTGSQRLTWDTVTIVVPPVLIALYPRNAFEYGIWALNWYSLEDCDRILNWAQTKGDFTQLLKSLRNY